MMASFNRYRHSQHALWRFVKFGMVGGTGFVVDSCVFLLLLFLGVPHLQARALSYWVSASNNWFLNRIFTFHDAPKVPPVGQWCQYLLMALGSFGLNWGTYYLLTDLSELFVQYKMLALIAGVGVGMLFNFSMANWVIFKRIHSV